MSPPRRARARSSTLETALYPSEASNSIFSTLLNHRRVAKFIPRRAQLKYYLRSATSYIPPRLLWYLIPALLLSFFALFSLYEPQIEITLYSRRWLRTEVDAIPPLSGCFDRAERDGSLYNVTERVWQKTSTWDVQSGLDMKKGLDCYDYAGIIGSPRSPRVLPHEPLAPEHRTVYHTYWRTDLAPFGPRQEYMLKSFFATQPLDRTRIILWSNGDLITGNAIIHGYLARFPDNFEVKIVNVKLLAMGTTLDGSDRVETKDEKAWVDGDLVRLLVLWHYGGVWVDMDSLLTRSLEPLLENEFVTQWDCYNKPYTPLNGALMHFHAQSPYLCEAFHIMATSAPPRTGSTDWGSLLYTKLWRRLVKAGIPPFKVLPWCFSDGRSCRLDNRLPDPFRKDGEGQGRWFPKPHASPSSSAGSGDTLVEWGTGELADTKSDGPRVMSMEEGGLLDEVLHKVFSVHLHNQWEKAFPKDGWVDRLLLRRYERRLRSIIDHRNTAEANPAE